MDEPAIKRLLIMLAVSIIAIFVLKTVLLKTATKVGNATVEKRQAAAPKPADAPPPPPPAIETPAAPASVAPLDTPALSGVRATQ